MKKVLLMLVVATLSLCNYSAVARDYDGEDYLERGFRGIVDVGAHYGFGDAKDNYQVTAAFTGGYQINRMIFVGGGIAPTLNLFDNKDVDATFLLPIYTSARFDFVNNHISPFVDARVGYNINTDDTDYSGAYAYLGAGCRINRLSLSAGYTYYGSKDSYVGSFAGVRIGFEF